MPAERSPSVAEAVALGLLQGPCELLPISSSAHTTLVPWLAGMPLEDLPASTRKSLEVALHAGGALALALELGPGLRRELRPLGGRATVSALAAVGLPALAGLRLRRRIERRLGGPATIAAGLAAGGVAMALADRRAAAPPARGPREAGPLDGLALGLAQTLALAPGVSRNGATLAAARARGFSRGGAETLSWGSGIPVMLGASVLEISRLRGGRSGSAAALAAGALASLLSTTAAIRLLGPRPQGRALLPYAVYRCLLALLVLVRLRRSQ